MTKMALKIRGERKPHPDKKNSELDLTSHPPWKQSKVDYKSKWERPNNKTLRDNKEEWLHDFGV